MLRVCSYLKETHIWNTTAKFDPWTMVVTWCLLVRFPIATTRMITETFEPDKTFEPDIHFPSSLQLRKEDISKILVIWFRRTAGWSELIPQGWLVTIKPDGEQIVPRIVRPAHPTGEQTTKSNLSGAGWCRLKRLPVLPVQTFPVDRKSINSTLNKNGYYVPHSCSVFFPCLLGIYPLILTWKIKTNIGIVVCDSDSHVLLFNAPLVDDLNHSQKSVHRLNQSSQIWLNKLKL